MCHDMCHDVYRRCFQLPQPELFRSPRSGFTYKERLSLLTYLSPDNSERSNEPERFRKHAQYKLGRLDLLKYSLSRKYNADRMWHDCAERWRTLWSVGFNNIDIRKGILPDRHFRLARRCLRWRWTAWMYNNDFLHSIKSTSVDRGLIRHASIVN